MNEAPDPSDTLRQLAAQGRQLRTEVIKHSEAKRAGPRNVATGVDVLDLFFDLSGYKRTAARVGRALVANQASKREQELTWRYQEWASAVRKELFGISEVKSRSTPRGNSHATVARFAKTQETVRLDSKLAKGVAFLETLADRQLMRNVDLAKIHPQTRAITRASLRPAIPRTQSSLWLNFLGPSERTTLSRLSERFPTEFEALWGAVSVYHAATPDAGRQALGSCRNCMENLVRRLSGESEWSVGLGKLIPGEAQRKTIRQVYALLSAYGTHASAPPPPSVAEMGIRLTLVAIASVMSAGGTTGI